MVDFKKRLKKRSDTKPLDLSDIYDSLDRASDKGPLRPVQTQPHDLRSTLEYSKVAK